MPIISANSTEIAYETFGQWENPAFLLISELGEQMVSWPKEFCQMLAENGFLVIRFDNRDTGFSMKLDTCGVPDLMKAWEADWQGNSITSPYTLRDMAADVVGLMGSLSIEKACIAGFSLGGMIAQNMAFTFSDRLAGMICMGSSTGARTLPPPRSEVQAAMSAPPPPLRDGFVGHSVSVYRSFSGGSALYDSACRTQIAELAFDRRGFYPEGFVRQSVAMLADGDRTERLKKTRVPTLALHGELDPVAPPAHGRAIADAVPGAEFRALADWEHGLDYPLLWPLLI